MPDKLLRLLHPPLYVSLALFAAAAAHAAQDPAPVRAVVTEYIRVQAAELPGAPEIVVAADGVSQLAECAALHAFLPGNPRLRSRMSVGVRCDAPASWTTYVTASIRIPGDYVVAARAIGAGDTLAAHDLARRHGDLLSLPQGARLRAEDAVGSVATRRIATGQVLRANALRSAQSVERGRTVRLVVNGRSFTATSEGEALASGAPGDYVQVRTTSGQLVSGIVRNASTVEILL